VKKILYIGGVGSDSHLVDAIAMELASQFNVNVIGMSFSEAHKNSARVARLVPESLVITHSAGMMLLKNMVPKELIAIAPPMPSLPSLLVWRSFPKTIAFIASGKESMGRPRKLLDYHLHSAKEHIVHPHHNSALLRQIGLFDAAQQAVEMVKCGSKVTLGFMENERLFPHAAMHPHVELAKEQGVTVVSMILGHHDEFVLYPTEVMAQLDRLTM
jgi:hypothetical protein